ncbi:MAG: O-antigen ligase family protein [Candidatus Acidiferrales bacterium]
MTDQTQALFLPSPAVQPSRKWPELAAFLVVGYLGIGRAFAYLGLPWFSIYIGEMALAAFLMFGPRTKQGLWLCLAHRVPQLKRFDWLVLLLLLYGGFEALRGILQGYPALTAVRDTAFNYYPLFFFLGVWVGLKDRDFLRRVVRTLAWFNGCYGLACVLFLSRIPWTMPGTADAPKPVLLFSEPSGASAIVLLGLIVLEPRLRKVWHLIALNALVLLGLQVRGEWVGFAVGVLVFAWLTKKFKQVAIAASVIVILLGFMYVTHLSLQSPKGRGDNVGTGTRISADYLVARAIAPLSQGLAARLATPEDVSYAAGTAEWRLVWWAAIWEEVHARLSSALLGFGYGYPIGNLNPDIAAGTFIQTPHSDFFYALAFSGWLGVTLFALLQIEIARLLWRSNRITGLPFGLMCWSAFLAMSMFEDFFETPINAIPFFLLLGAAIAPALIARRRSSLNCRRAPLPGCPEAQPT